MPAVGAIVGAAGSLVGGKMQSDAAGKAGDASTAASRDAIQAQVAMYNQSRADTMPYQVVGNGALNVLAGWYGLPTYSAPISSGIQITQPEPAKKKKRSLFDKVTDPANLAGQFGGTSYDPMGFFSSGTTGGGGGLTISAGGGGGGVGGGAGGGVLNPGTGTPDFTSYYQTPDFLVARDEGINALDRGAAARGGLYSGGADADRMTFGSNLGSKAFGNAANNLFRLAGLGSNANSELNSLGQNTAGQIGNQLTNAGNARASAYWQQGQAQANTLNNLAGFAGSYFGSR
ncbi:hypothetical protein SAMN05720615_11841 [Stenotrophomonas indicatrix]|nr:hypothetical protein SAMN05720615_109207 [Stenotrophomonas indicatrix]SEU12808.1 hypothetical protein SAMN05720615_11841 [Stenotrophomonas indicatrix]